MVYTYATYVDPFEKMFANFNRDFQEVRGMKFWFDETKNEATVFINALGVSPDDVEITYKNGNKQGSVEFHVKGETSFTEHLKAYSIDYAFVSYLPVKKVIKKFFNGLIVLTLICDKPAQPDIEVVSE